MLGLGITVAWTPAMFVHDHASMLAALLRSSDSTLVLEVMLLVFRLTFVPACGLTSCLLPMFCCCVAYLAILIVTLSKMCTLLCQRLRSVLSLLVLLLLRLTLPSLLSLFWRACLRLQSPCTCFWLVHFVNPLSFFSTLICSQVFIIPVLLSASHDDSLFCH